MFIVRAALRLIKLGAILAALLGLAWYFRQPILSWAARSWIIDDATSKADAIVVLGGGRDWRPFAAADMYLAGEAPIVLVTQPEKSPSQNILDLPTEAEANTAILKKKGVPDSAIQPLGQNVTSTRDEALALREWVVTHHAKNVIVPTDSLHTRRARWIFNKALDGTGATVHMRAIPHPRYTTENWWQVEDGFIGFQSELMKSLYYVLNH